MRPEIKCRIAFRAGLSPSEDRLKVEEAVRNVIGYDIEFRVDPNRVHFVTEDTKSLIRLREQLRDRRIRSTARRLLLEEKRAGSTSLMINRQAATIGVIALCGSPEESPLGPIYLTIDSPSIDEVIDWLTSYSPG